MNARALLSRVRRARPAAGASDAGTTLIEVAVAVAVFAVVIAIVFETMISSSRHIDDIDAQVQGEAEARLVIDRFTRDLRQAHTGGTTNVVATMTATQLSFYSPDRSTPMRVRRITYMLDTANRTLLRGETLSADMTLPPAPTTFRTELQGVSSTSLFAYRNVSGSTATAAAQVRTVILTLAVDRDPNRAPGPQDYSITVELRAHRPTGSA